HIPVNGALVAVRSFVVAAPRSEVDAAGDLFVEEDILHWPRAMRVESDGEFSNVAGALVGVQDLVELPGVRARGLDDLAVLEYETHVIMRLATIERRGVEVNDAVGAVANGRGKYLAVR